MSMSHLREVVSSSHCFGNLKTLLWYREGHLHQSLVVMAEFLNSKNVWSILRRIADLPLLPSPSQISKEKAMAALMRY